MANNIFEARGYANRNELYDINSVASWSSQMLRVNEDYFLGLLSEDQLKLVKEA
jgi:hypothetical protein